MGSCEFIVLVAASGCAWNVLKIETLFLGWTQSVGVGWMCLRPPCSTSHLGLSLLCKHRLLGCEETLGMPQVRSWQTISWGQIWLATWVFFLAVKFYRNIVTSICFHIVCDCPGAVIAELKNCKGNYISKSLSYWISFPFMEEICWLSIQVNSHPSLALRPVCGTFQAWG